MEKRQRYTSDLTDGEWQILEPWIPAAKPGGRPRKHDMREIVNAIRYLLRTGCSWRLIPHDFPPYRAVFHYFRTWRKDRTWERMHAGLRGDVRQASGRNRSPSAGVVDSQSVKTTEKGGSRASMGISE